MRTLKLNHNYSHTQGFQIVKLVDVDMIRNDEIPKENRNFQYNDGFGFGFEPVPKGMVLDLTFECCNSRVFWQRPRRFTHYVKGSAAAEKHWENMLGDEFEIKIKPPVRPDAVQTDLFGQSKDVQVINEAGVASKEQFNNIVVTEEATNVSTT